MFWLKRTDTCARLVYHEEDLICDAGNGGKKVKKKAVEKEAAQEFLTTGPTCEGCKTGVSNVLCRHRQGISRHSECGLRRCTDVDAFHCRFTQRPWLFFDHTTSEAQQSGGAAMLQPTRRSAARPHHRRSAPSEHGHEAFRTSPILVHRVRPPRAPSCRPRPELTGRLHLRHFDCSCPTTP